MQEKFKPQLFVWFFVKSSFVISSFFYSLKTIVQVVSYRRRALESHEYENRQNTNNSFASLPLRHTMIFLLFGKKLRNFNSKPFCWQKAFNKYLDGKFELRVMGNTIVNLEINQKLYIFLAFSNKQKLYAGIKIHHVAFEYFSWCSGVQLSAWLQILRSQLWRNESAKASIKLLITLLASSTCMILDKGNKDSMPCWGLKASKKTENYVPSVSMEVLVLH